MKISEIHPGQIPDAKGQSPDKTGNDGQSFQRIMEQVSHGEGGKENPVEGSGPVLPGQEIQIIPGVGKVEPTQESTQKTQVLRAIEETLDTVDAYAAALRNGSLSTSDMKPLVEHLEIRLEGLRQLEVDPELPEGLRTVVSDLSLTIGTEVAKFGRGDYE